MCIRDRFEYDKTGVGIRLEMLRKKANSSREKAAEDLDISKDSLYAYEKGKSIMSAEVLAKVCILYNTSMDYLLNGCESENNVIIPEICLLYTSLAEILHFWVLI